eukprot:3563343-Lingulodinium_polyedra.AAC.1
MEFVGVSAPVAPRRVLRSAGQLLLSGDVDVLAVMAMSVAGVEEVVAYLRRRPIGVAPCAFAT